MTNVVLAKKLHLYHARWAKKVNHCQIWKCRIKACQWY